MKRLKRKGTVRLLYLTEDMPEDKKYELLTYIGHLETNEDKVFLKLEQFISELAEIRVSLGECYPK